SGSALATSANPTMPPAPGLVSMTIGWPTSCETLSSTTRLTVSEALPGGNGLITLIGRVGQSSAAAAEASSSTAPSTPANGRNDNTGISYSVTSAEPTEQALRRGWRAGASAGNCDSSFCRRLNRADDRRSAQRYVQ